MCPTLPVFAYFSGQNAFSVRCLSKSESGCFIKIKEILKFLLSYVNPFLPALMLVLADSAVHFDLDRAHPEV